MVACRCVCFQLFKLEHFCCHLLDEASVGFNIICFLVSTLVHHLLGLSTLFFGALCWFIILDESNHTQVFLYKNRLFAVFQKCWFCNSPNKLRNVGWQCGCVLINKDGVARFGDHCKFVQYVCKPLIEVFYIFFSLHLGFPIL